LETAQHLVLSVQTLIIFLLDMRQRAALEVDPLCMGEAAASPLLSS